MFLSSGCESRGFPRPTISKEAKTDEATEQHQPGRRQWGGVDAHRPIIEPADGGCWRVATRAVKRDEPEGYRSTGDRKIRVRTAIEQMKLCRSEVSKAEGNPGGTYGDDFGPNVEITTLIEDRGITHRVGRYGPGAGIIEKIKVETITYGGNSPRGARIPNFSTVEMRDGDTLVRSVVVLSGAEIGIRITPGQNLTCTESRGWI